MSTAAAPEESTVRRLELVKTQNVSTELSDSACIVDIQYVCDRGNMYIKELAFLEPYSFTPSVYWFKPPYKNPSLAFSNHRNYIYRNINGLRWEDGEIDYNKIGSIIMAFSLKYNTFQVKGLEKKRTLESFLPEGSLTSVIDLVLLEPLEKMKPYSIFCPVHHLTRARCAARHVKLIRLHL